MQILLTPQFSEEELIDYEFNGNIIKFSQGETTGFFDLSNIEEGKQYFPQFPIQDVYRKGGELYVELLNFVDEEAPEEELFPEWKKGEESDFEIQSAAIVLEEEPIEEEKPSSEQLLEQRFDILSQAIEELIILTTIQTDTETLDDLGMDITRFDDESALM